MIMGIDLGKAAASSASAASGKDCGGTHVILIAMHQKESAGLRTTPPRPAPRGSTSPPEKPDDTASRNPQRVRGANIAGSSSCLCETAHYRSATDPAACPRRPTHGREMAFRSSAARFHAGPASLLLRKDPSIHGIGYHWNPIGFITERSGAFGGKEDRVGQMAASAARPGPADRRRPHHNRAGRSPCSLARPEGRLHLAENPEPASQHTLSFCVHPVVGPKRPGGTAPQRRPGFGHVAHLALGRARTVARRPRSAATCKRQIPPSEDIGIAPYVSQKQ